MSAHAAGLHAHRRPRRAAWLAAIPLVAVCMAGCAHAARAQVAPAPANASFRTGDRIVLLVEGERQLSDTFTVHDGPAIELPVIGDISLAGVRRDEIQPYLSGEIGRYVKSTIVQAHALVRVGVLGEVAKPGYYNLPADALLSDAFTAAGGVAQDARIAKVTVQRTGKTVVQSDALRRGMARGVTIADLGIRSGDEVVVPRNNDMYRTVQIIGILLTIPAAIYAASFIAR